MSTNERRLAVTYINPDAFSGKKAADAMQPLAIAALAAHTPKCFDIAFFDDRIEEIDYEKKTDLVVISVLTFTANRSYKIADEFRKRGVPVILGGFHPTLLPEESLLYADCIVTGDAENMWNEVLNDFSNSKLKNRYDAGICSDSALIRFDRTIFKGKKYTPMIPVQLGRGCRYSCDFCSVHSFYGNAHFTRKISDVVDEISNIKSKFIFFTDDNILSDRVFILEFLGQMMKLKKHWSCQISIEASCDNELLSALSKAGCLSVFIGFESMKKDSLKQMGKGTNLKHLDYPAAVSAFANAGILVSGSFVFGYPGDSKKSIDEALKFGIKNKLTLCHFNPLFPFPKTRIYDALQKQNRLRFKAWWTDACYRYGEPMFDPVDIDGTEMNESCQEAREQFNSFRNIFLRSLSPKNNLRNPFHLFAFFISNFISRREIKRKHKARLG